MTDMTTPCVPKLTAALAKVQARLPKLERDRTVEVQQKNGGSYSYSYVTLANLTDAILPLLAEHGLAFVAMPGVGSDGKMALRYHLLHESGESLTGEFPISGEGGIQMVGGRITYSKRYCLAAVVGVAADEDDESRLDSDHAPRTAQRAAAPAKRQTAAAAKPAGRTTQRATPPPLPTDGPAPYTPAQRAKMMAAFGQLGIDDRAERLDICSKVVGRNLGSANELTKDEARRLIDVLEQATAAENPQLFLAEQTATPPEEPK
jgi:hypothetical protein